MKSTEVTALRAVQRQIEKKVRNLRLAAYHLKLAEASVERAAVLRALDAWNTVFTAVGERISDALNPARR